MLKKMAGLAGAALVLAMLLACGMGGGGDDDEGDDDDDDGMAPRPAAVSLY